MTLIELLVSIFVIGSIVAVLAATVTVTFRQQEDTQGRLDVARWGQSLALWLPTDLASANDVKDEEVLDPQLCPSAECTFGSNALWLRWDDGTGVTTVSYRYGTLDGGASFILTRVECKGGGCSSRVVLRDLLGPVDVDGNPVTWNAGDPVPNEVIDVTVPLAVLGPPTTDPDAYAQGARRVIVNVNGAPSVDGADRSSSVSFTAGGSSFATLEASTFTEPTFLPANSGCGGPVTLIVDESGSLTNADIDAVQDGVRSFVKAFEGTPTRLQIILFDTRSTTLGAGGSWNRFFDLADPPSVDELIGVDGNSGLVDDINDDGGTNWEDAFFRAWYRSDGTTYDTNPDLSAPTPELIVFFTDGVPTFDRQAYKSDSTTVVNVTTPVKFTYQTAGTSGASYGNDFSPRGWHRADMIADLIRQHDPPVRLIGVGVGDAFDESHRIYWPRTGWPTSPDSRYIPNEEFLGDLVGGDDVSLYDDDAPRGFIKREYSSVSGVGWGDVSAADLLVTNDWDQFGGALTAIALADCGGTLSVQTRDQAGDPADAEITYEIGTQTVTTTRVVKAATFDINLAGIASTEVVMLPQPFDATGYTAQTWGCRAVGEDLVAGASIPAGESGYRVIDASNPMAGIGVTVSGDAAVSCTLRVTP
jgi:hypothetical protein